MTSIIYMDSYIPALGSCSLVGSNGLQLAKGTPVITRFIYHAPLDLEFNIITHLTLPPPTIILFISFTLKTIPAQQVKTLVILNLYFCIIMSTTLYP